MGCFLFTDTHSNHGYIVINCKNDATSHKAISIGVDLSYGAGLPAAVTTTDQIVYS